MSDDYNERTRLMGITNTIGQIAWMIVPWFWALISNPDYIFATQVEGVRKLSIVVAALSIVTGIMPAILKWVAFDQNAAVQTSETLTQLRLADIIVPAESAFVAIFVMSGYNLTESKMAEIKAELKKRRG